MSRKGGERPHVDNAVDDGNAQEAALTGGLGERVISVPLLPFAADRGKRELRQYQSFHRAVLRASTGMLAPTGRTASARQLRSHRSCRVPRPWRPAPPV